MKLTLQLVVDVLIAPTTFRDNLFKFTLYIIIIYKVGDKRCHLRRHALIQQLISFIDLYLVFSISIVVDLIFVMGLNLLTYSFYVILKFPVKGDFPWDLMRRDGGLLTNI